MAGSSEYALISDVRDLGVERCPDGAILCPILSDDPCDFAIPIAHPDRSGMTDGLSILRCRRCGIGVTRPPLPDVAFLYSDRGSQDFQPSRNKLTDHLKSIVYRHQARALLDGLGSVPEQVIDFGCGDGLFTRKLAELLPDANVVGVDFHGHPPCNLSRTSYRPFSSAGELAATADVVLAMHVLEHDDNPAAVLERIVHLAKPGGLVVLEVPNVDCHWTRAFGHYWDGWYLPYHRVHFSRAGLDHLLERLGLTIEQHVSICVPSMGRTVANLLRRHNSPVFILLGAALFPIQWLGERISRRPSALRVIARVPA